MYSAAVPAPGSGVWSWLRAARVPMMRRAESHTASIAPIIGCPPVSTSLEQAFELRSHARIEPSAGSACPSTSNSARPLSVGTMVLALRGQGSLPLQPRVMILAVVCNGAFIAAGSAPRRGGRSGSSFPGRRS